MGICLLEFQAWTDGAAASNQVSEDPVASSYKNRLMTAGNRRQALVVKIWGQLRLDQ